jgi:hypothetical protein
MYLYAFSLVITSISLMTSFVGSFKVPQLPLQQFKEFLVLRTEHGGEAYGSKMFAGSHKFSQWESMRKSYLRLDGEGERKLKSINLLWERKIVVGQKLKVFNSSIISSEFFSSSNQHNNNFATSIPLTMSNQLMMVLKRMMKICHFDLQ